MSRIGRFGVSASLVLGAIAAAGAQEAAPVNATADAAKIDVIGIAPAGGGPVVNKPIDLGKFKDFNEVTKDAEKVEGLFTLYKSKDGEHLYAEIRPDQFNQTLLVPVTIARGMANAGTPVGDDDLVIIFKRVGDRIQIVRRNIFFKAPSGTPIEKSVRQNYTDSIIMSLPIVTINLMRGAAPLIDLSDVFMTDFAQLGLGSIDRNRSSWQGVKGFPNNMELELETTYAGGGRGRGDAVADMRGNTIVVHYSLMKTPDAGYRTRAADDRVGYFLSAAKDFGITSEDGNFARYIYRWRLEKVDPKAKLSPPKKQIVWYIEDTVPQEYRPFVEEGILEWNKAFEKIGFRNAIAVRWQEAGRDDFDPEDVNYCTFRWVTSESGSAMSCVRANPMTGEIIDGDVIFDSSWIRHWKQEYALLIGNVAAAEGGVESTPLAMGEVVSPILASKMGYGVPRAAGMPGLAPLSRVPGQMTPELIPADQGLFQWRFAQNLARNARGLCQRQLGFSQDLTLAAVAMAGGQTPAVQIDPAKKDDDKKDGDKKDDDKKDEKKDEKKKKTDELPEEFVSQAIKDVVMHEVGHSLGLRHNFKASTMLSAEQLNDTAITKVKGLGGSVMDYNPVNLAPRGQKQGDYYSTTIGPYDYWAIEYGYSQVQGDEGAELKKIASRAAEKDLVYATDEDVVFNDDPYVNRWDLGSDPMRFAQDRIELARSLLKDLDSRVVNDGEPWARMRRAFSVLLNQWGNAATLASQYVAGQSVSRDHKADKEARDPIVPITGEKQRENLKFLAEHVLTDKDFAFSPAVMRRLGNERWLQGLGAMSGSGSADISVYERILGIQRIVLGHCLNGSTLSRLQNQELQTDAGGSPLRIAEVFRSLTDAIWGDLDKLAEKKEGDAESGLSTIRRNLQREHLRRLGTLVVGSGGPDVSGLGSFVVILGGGGSVPADARSLARMHLKDVAARVAKALDAKDAKLDDVTRAHLEEVKEKIAKILDARIDSRDL